MSDYTKLSGGALLEAVGDDAYKWAEAFCQIKAKNGWTIDDIDHGLMLAWFANAIVHAQDVARWRKERAENNPILDRKSTRLNSSH